jgi:hypothetical protein
MINLLTVIEATLDMVADERVTYLKLKAGDTELVLSDDLYYSEMKRLSDVLHHTYHSSNAPVQFKTKSVDLYTLLVKLRQRLLVSFDQWESKLLVELDR